MVPAEAEVKYDLPTFTDHLNNLSLKEKERAVFECKVQPAQDPTMKIGMTRATLRMSYI